MLSIIIRRIVTYWSSSGIISNSDSDIYEYGLELLSFSVLNVTAIMVTAIFTNRVPESVALIASVIPLQSFGGGYHAKTHLRCFLIMYIGWWIIMWIMPFITPLAGGMIASTSLIIIFILAPVPNENVSISSKQRLKMKTIVRAVSVCIIIISLATSGVVINYKNISSSLMIGIGAIALSMLAARFKETANKVIVNSNRFPD